MQRVETGSPVRAYLQLLRLPAVFTAFADVFLGFLLVHVALAPAAEFLALLAASGCLYLAGMVLNDLFDRKRDAAERPERPIPSGRVSPRSAACLAGVLILLGLGCAWAASPWSLLIAGLLVACILAYDGWLKSTPAGPLAMGACRSLNVLLGASSAAVRFNQLWQLPQTYIAGALGVYIAGVTWFARREADRSRPAHLLGAAAVLNAGLIGLLLLTSGPVARSVKWNGAADALSTLVLFAVIMLTINRRIVRAAADPSPGTVQTAVRTMLLSLITLDAALIYAKLGADGMAPAAGVLLLLVPAVALGRWMSVT